MKKYEPPRKRPKPKPRPKKPKVLKMKFNSHKHVGCTGVPLGLKLPTLDERWKRLGKFCWTMWGTRQNVVRYQKDWRFYRHWKFGEWKAYRNKIKEERECEKRVALREARRK